MICLIENRAKLSLSFMIKIVLLVILISCSYKVQSNAVLIQQNLSNLNSNIQGVWVSEEDPNWKLEFNSNGHCYWYYTNEDTEVFNYSILTTSPQCGQNVKTGGLEDFYLRLIGQESSSEEYCYEILGVNSESLSISTIGLGVKNYYFNKQ